MGFFESIGLPAIAAYLVVASEILGGIALILGAFTRLAAWLSLPILLVSLAVAIGIGEVGKYAIDNLDWMKNLNLTQSTAEQATA